MSQIFLFGIRVHAVSFTDKKRGRSIPLFCRVLTHLTVTHLTDVVLPDYSRLVLLELFLFFLVFFSAALVCVGAQISRFFELLSSQPRWFAPGVPISQRGVLFVQLLAGEFNLKIKGDTCCSEVVSRSFRCCAAKTVRVVSSRCASLTARQLLVW